ncbi:MAG: hypothetical protein A2X82_17760 [Geobacteraceae bacterium GWC2_55_20]|nr:MAG: hypothetical protein A2X82_17760 [Geobacteraceae bacterium GWC2_55_20]OGU21339.1 MAG: hypothetical protein A2X85_10470 [Geobacteraceae bacterium GWF2_54_21]HBA72683.1 hypothetical protein [Geobacter sp.]HCE69485.1 hypothetical protein [Geobacter sp.]
MGYLDRIIRPVCISLLVMLLGTGFLFAAEVDDAAVFVDAFAAYQKKDYLTAIEKADQLIQMFPDSPLRDVTLLLIARSCIKSGDNQRAAKALTSFNNEFSESNLKTTVEEELLSLAIRYKNGEQLAPNKQLQSAAQKVRAERLAQERAAAAKLEQERLAREKAERERIAREKIEAERRAREKLAAEKAAKESIKAVITVKDGKVVAAGENGGIPFEVSNRGKNSEEFMLEAIAPPEFAVSVTSLSNRDAAVTRIKLAAGETFKGSLSLRMPSDRVDGARTTITIKTTSATYSDVFQQKNVLTITSAPLVRAVAKLAKNAVAPGEQLNYRVTILNIGSLPAQSLTVRLQLPLQLDFLGAHGQKFRQEPDGTLIFRVEQIDPGKLAELKLDVRVLDKSNGGQKLGGQVEVINGQLQRKDIFSAVTSVIRSKP